MIGCGKLFLNSHPLKRIWDSSKYEEVEELIQKRVHLVDEDVNHI